MVSVTLPRNEQLIPPAEEGRKGVLMTLLLEEGSTFMNATLLQGLLSGFIWFLQPKSLFFQ